MENISNCPVEKTWVDNEFRNLDLNDKRLDARLKSILKTAGANPEKTINGMNKNWKGTKASYRFMDNKKVTPEKMFKPHTEETLNRINLTKEIVLLVQDTVFISYNTLEDTTELGTIGSKESKGIVVHNAFSILSLPTSHELKNFSFRAI
jgi:hypothetical protein